MRVGGCFLGIAAVLSGCTQQTFQCEEDSACVLGGIAGACEGNGFCSFPDEECSSGRRFGEGAPPELAGVCVSNEGSSGADGSTSSTGATSIGPATTFPQLTSSTGSSGLSSSDSSSESSSSSGRVPGPDPNFMFVTSQPVPRGPDLVGAADDLCNALAMDADLPGEFIAWLSTSEVGAIDRLRGARGWVRPDGRPFADRPSDIVEGRIFYPPVLDELGAEVRNRGALTGTSALGEAAANCEDWMIGSEGSVTIGEPGATFSAWTTERMTGCADTSTFGVYCFGVDVAVPVDLEPEGGRLAFVTASTLNGSEGLSGYDNACAMEASAAELPGTFLALVATSAQSALSRFDTSGAAWVNMLGVPLANTAAALTVVSHLDAPPSFTATGEPVAGSYWVGSTLPTTVGDSTCANWTGEGSARIYDTEDTTDWFNHTPTSCDGMLHVLCFEE